jgi:UrcA family protein
VPGRSPHHHFSRFKVAVRAAHIDAARQSLEIDMKTNILIVSSLICIAAVAACAALLRPVRADSHEVTVKISVNAAGLDVNQPAGAAELYSRLRQAARIACTGANRVGLEPVDNVQNCTERALGEAVRTANQPQLTLAYLQKHTPQEAATRGIVVPTLVAAK